MKIIEQSICDIPSGIICHQVNCQKVANSGLAKQIRDKFPGWYDYYINTEPSLGITTLFKVSNELLIANFYAQEYYGKIGKHTNYDAFDSCCRELKRYTKFENKIYYFPYKIGCGLGGGNWHIVKAIIEANFNDFVIVKYCTNDKENCNENKR